VTARARRTALIAASVPRRDEADLLHRRDEPRDALGELDLGAAGGAVGGPRGSALRIAEATAFGMCPKRCGPYDMT
jgi:hypothetical protein